jgi:superfamily II DNA or RNA helicase
MGLLGRVRDRYAGLEPSATRRLPLEFRPGPITTVAPVDVLFAKVKVVSQFDRDLIEFWAPENLAGVSEDLAYLGWSLPSSEFSSLPSAVISEDLAGQLLSEKVSTNLFQVLGQPRKVDGRAYGRSGEIVPEGDQPSLFPMERDSSGYRKSFRVESRTKMSATVKTLSIWDLILPLLQPPVLLDLRNVVHLPSPLYGYQIDGVRFLLDHESALLGDDMGTGKTVQSIVAMRILFQTGKIKSALIVCPLSVMRNWDRELEKWAPTLSPTVVRGPVNVREACWRNPAHVWLTTYDTLRNDTGFLNGMMRRAVDAGNGLNFDLVVLDEVQKIKNPSSGIAQAVRQLKARVRWGLSGTPIENRIEDVAAIFAFLKPGALRLEGLDPTATRIVIAPYFLRRRKADVLPDLPAKINNETWLPLEGEQRRAYESAERDGIVYLKELGERVTVQHVLALLTRLKQLCNVDLQSGESAKLEWLKENVEDIIESGDKALIYSQYLDSGVKWLEDAISQFSPLSYTGSLSDRERAKVLDAFVKRDDARILLMTRSGGLGLNLTVANYVVHVDHWWNPATGAQAEDRVHRIGQAKKVFVYHLWSENTVEERIYRILEKKRRLYEEVIDALSNVQGSGLSEEELFGLFGLQRPGRTREAGEPPISDTASLLAISPENFEVLVGTLYKRLGYGVRMTQRSRDGGIDLIVTREMDGVSLKLAIQCKRFASPVGVEYARELLGVVNHDATITKGILVSASTFTEECRHFCESNGQLELMDGATLIRLINT